MSNSNRSRGSQFLHDLRTVDFEHADIYTGVRIAIYLTPVLISGLITKHESSLVVLGSVYVLGIDEIFRPVGRTRTLLSVSVLLCINFRHRHAHKHGQLYCYASSCSWIIFNIILQNIFKRIHAFKVCRYLVCYWSCNSRYYFNSHWSGIPTGSYRWIMGYTRWYNFSRS